MDAWLRPRPFEDLFLASNWTRSLALIIGGLVLSFLLLGFWWPYWRVADMDFWMAYEGFLFNDGLAQEYFDHPGYLTILLVGGWFHVLHGVGLLDVHALSSLPPPAEAHEAWTHAIRAGRVLSLLLAISFVVTFGMLLRRLIGDWRIAILATFALTFSGALAMQARVMRTELLSAGFVMIALLLLLIAAREPRNPWRPLLCGLAALLAMLGLVNKVQVIFLICAIPLMVLPFGRASEQSGGFWRTSRLALPLAALLAAVAAFAAIYAAPLVDAGLSAVGRWVPREYSGIYQPLAVAWIILAVIAFAVLWRVSIVETLATIAAVIAGAALGLLSLKLRYHPNNLLAVMNPVEQMLSFAIVKESRCLGIAPAGGLICSLIEGVGGVFARRTFVLHSSSRPAIFLEWFVIALTVVAWRRGEKKLAGFVVVVMLVVWGIDTIGMLRGLKAEYFLYTDPLVIIAAALLLVTLADLRLHRWVFPLGVAFFTIHIVLSQAKLVKHSFMRRQPLAFCEPYFYYTKRIEGYSFCPQVNQPPPVR